MFKFGVLSRQRFTPSDDVDANITDTVLLLNSENKSYDTGAGLRDIDHRATVTGTPMMSDFSPYRLYWSTVFAEDQALRYSATAFGTGDFTIEFWIKFKDNSLDTGNRSIFSQTADLFTGLQIYITNTNVTVNGKTTLAGGLMMSSDNDIVGTGVAINDDQWHHVAFVRSNGTIFSWVDGILKYSESYANDISATTDFCIGNYAGNEAYRNFIGYLSNLRVSSTPIYDAPFIPPTEPFVATTTTTLLVCNSRNHRDSSFNQRSLTHTWWRSPQCVNEHPFDEPDDTYRNHSYYFTSSSTVVEANYTDGFFGTDDFTVELWAFHETAISMSTNELTLLTWRSPLNNTRGPSLYYKNGAFHWYAGPLFPIGGDNWTDIHNTVRATYSGTGTTLTVTAVSEGVIKTGMWPTGALGRQFITGYSTGTGNTGNYILGSSNNISAQTNQYFHSYQGEKWVHIAYVRKNLTGTLYLDGKPIASGPDSRNYTSAEMGSRLQIGKYYNNKASGGADWTGWIKDVRIVNGTAVYDGEFTPPIKPLETIPNTVLLTCAHNVNHRQSPITDNSSYKHNARLRNQYKFSGWNPYENLDSRSIEFNGMSSYISSPSAWQDDISGYTIIPGNSTWTIEAWIFLNRVSGFAPIIGAVILDTTGNQSWSVSINNSRQLEFVHINSSTTYTGTLGTITIPLETWTHVMVSIQAGTLRLFVDGVAGPITGTTSVNGGTHSSNAIVYIGRKHGVSLDGKIAGLRVQKGVFFNSDFVPPYVLEKTNETSLLLGYPGDVYRDRGLNALYTTYQTSMSSSGPGPRPSSMTDVTGKNYSIYLDGVGDRIEVDDHPVFSLGDEPFTFSFWAMFEDTAAISSNRLLFSHYVSESPNFYGWRIFASNISVSGNHSVIIEIYQKTTSYTINLDCDWSVRKWNHIIVERNDSGEIQCYINGLIPISSITLPVSGWTSTTIPVGNNSTDVLRFGEGFKGYISDIRLVKRSLYYTPVELSHAISISTISSVFKISEPANFDFGLDDFTVEFFYRVNTNAALTAYLFKDDTPGNTFFQIYRTTNLIGSGPGVKVFVQGLGDIITGPDSVGLTLGQWYHLAFSRKNGVSRLFIDGTQIGNDYNDTNDYNATVLSFGYWNDGFSGYVWTGAYAQISILNGTGLYDSNFNAPTQAPAKTQDTVLRITGTWTTTPVDTSDYNHPITLSGSVVPAYDDPVSPVIDIGYPTKPSENVNGTVLLLVNEDIYSNRVGDGIANKIYVGERGPKLDYVGPYEDHITDSKSMLSWFDSVAHPDNANFQVGTGNMCLECWVYNLENSGYGNGGSYTVVNFGGFALTAGVHGFSSGWLLRVPTSGTGGPGTSAGSAAVSQGAPYYGEWVHLIAIKSGSNYAMYLNGQATEVVYGTNVSQTGLTFSIGGFKGYVTGVRYHNGQTLFDTGKTSPTYAPIPFDYMYSDPPTAESAVRVYTLYENNDQIDNLAVRADGNKGSARLDSSGSFYGTSLTPFTPKGYVQKFNGTNTNLTLNIGSGTNNLAIGNDQPFTIEFWVYRGRNQKASHYFNGGLGGGIIDTANKSIAGPLLFSPVTQGSEVWGVAADGSQRWTIEMWIYPTENNTGNVFFIWSPKWITNSADVGIQMYMTGAEVRTRVDVNTSTVYNLTYPNGATIPTGQWSHIALVRTEISGQPNMRAQLYLNGVSGPPVAFNGNVDPFLNRSDLSSALGFQTASSIVGWSSTGGTYFDGYISNLRIVKGLAGAPYGLVVNDEGTQVFTPPTKPLRPIAGVTKWLVHNDFDFFDDSGKATTRYNDIALSRFTPFTEQLGNEYIMRYGQRTSAVDADRGIEIHHRGAVIGVRTSTTDADFYNVNFPEEIPDQQWAHVAIVRDSNNLVKAYLNGVAGAGVTINGAIDPLAANTQAGDDLELNFGWSAKGDTVWGDYWQGYMSNFRWVVGQAVYTDTFTPSKEIPLTAITGTKLLIMRGIDQHKDWSSYDHSLTGIGDWGESAINPLFRQKSSYNPITQGGSVYFPGHNNYLYSLYQEYHTDLSLITKFTFECWIYPFGINDNGWFFSIGESNYSSIQCGYNNTGDKFKVNFTDGTVNNSLLLTSTDVFPEKKWYHYAVTKSDDGTAKLYINGREQASGNISFTLRKSRQAYINAASGSNGQKEFITGIKLTSDKVVYTGNFDVPTRVPFVGENESVPLLVNVDRLGLYDRSGCQVVIPTNTRVRSYLTNFNNSAIYFDGTSSFITIEDNDLLRFQERDWTIEFQIRREANVNATIFAFCLDRTTGYSSIRLDHNTGGGMTLLLSNDGQSWKVNSGLSIGLTSGRWHHVSISKSGTNTNNLKAFVDGVLAFNTTFNHILYEKGTMHCIGNHNITVAERFLNGRLDDFRVTRNVGRYPSIGGFAEADRKMPVR